MCTKLCVQIKCSKIRLRLCFSSTHGPISPSMFLFLCPSVDPFLLTASFYSLLDFSKHAEKPDARRVVSIEEQHVCSSSPPSPRLCFTPSPSHLRASPLSAHEFCRQRRRSTVTAEDVLAAVAEIHFPEFLPALQQTLEGTVNDNDNVQHFQPPNFQFPA